MTKTRIALFLGILTLFSAFATGCKKKETVKLYTDEATQITSNSAVVRGEVKSDVLLDELGVCYGTSANPTINDKTKTADSDLTSFKCQLNNLQENQSYYARAYAVTSRGNTYYGNEVSFETNNEGWPTISISADKTAIANGETVTLTVQADASVDSRKDISTVAIDIVSNGENVYSTTEEVNAATFSQTYELAFTGATGDAFEITATATDAAGKSASSTVNVTIEEEELSETAFVWERTGSNAGTGLDVFGLQWTSNLAKAIYAVIKPMEGAKLYQLNSSVYAAATTASQKVAAFEGATEIEQWKEFNVSGATTQTFDVVLGTIYNGEYHLINVTKGTYDSGSYGVHATISGMAK